MRGGGGKSLKQTYLTLRGGRGVGVGKEGTCIVK